MPRPGVGETVMKVVGRVTAITCKCGATIICPTRTRVCVKEHVVFVDADEEHLDEKEDNEIRGKNADVEGGNSKDKEITTNKSRNRVLATDGLCVVCMSNPPEAVYFPCGHLVACMDCASKINHSLCLICRAEIEQIVKPQSVSSRHQKRLCSIRLFPCDFLSTVSIRVPVPSGKSLSTSNHEKEEGRKIMQNFSAALEKRAVDNVRWPEY